MLKNADRFIKPLTSVSMLLTTGWLVSDWQKSGFPWEPATVLLGLLITYVAMELRQTKELFDARSVERGNDAELFLQLQELLPSHGAIDFVKHHDFGGSFHLEDLDKISQFRREWDNPQHEFNDPELEAQRANLLHAARYFSQAIALKTSPRMGVQSAVPRHVPSDGPFPEWVKRDILEIHQAADALINEHAKMMRLGRKRLRLRRSAEEQRRAAEETDQ